MKTNPELWLEDTSLRRKSIGIEFHGNEFLGHMIAPSEASGPRPLVLVIHNYQGLKGFDVDVAEYLARVGYVGLAIDMYGNDVPADERRESLPLLSVRTLSRGPSLPNAGF